MTRQQEAPGRGSSLEAEIRVAAWAAGVAATSAKVPIMPAMRAITPMTRPARLDTCELRFFMNPAFPVE